MTDLESRMANRTGRAIRDSQQSKVYRAEYRMRSADLDGKRFNTIKAIDRWVNSTVLRSPWYKKKFPSGPFILAVEAKKSGWAYGSAWRLRLPKWAWTKLTILHEVTHGTVAMNYDQQYKHGWQFTKTFLLLIQHFLGKSYADLLKMEYKTLKVKYKAPKILSEPTRMKLRERGLALAAKREEKAREKMHEAWLNIGTIGRSD